MHPDFRFEVAHLETISDKLAETIDTVKQKVQDSQTKIEQLTQSSSGYDDAVQVAINLHRGMVRYNRALQTAVSKPYFGRIDFLPDDDTALQSYYIGKVGILDEQTNKPYIVDWRAPIASLYYGAEIGDTMYLAPEGAVFGTMPLKRQYHIENGRLIDVYDKNIAPVDEFLNAELAKSKDNRLSDIVSTIQSEQNSVIRRPKDHCVIVQGVAGSGKTTIVLHRLAYLLYNYQDTIKPEQVLILVPNALFLNYISDVLPDLGVQDINQMTFEQLALQLAPAIQVKPDLFIENLYESNSTLSLDRLAVLKGEQFMQVVNDALTLAKEQLINSVIAVADQFKLQSVELAKLMREDYRYLPLNKALTKVKTIVFEQLEKRWQSDDDKRKAQLIKHLKGLNEDDLKRRIAFEQLEQENEALNETRVHQRKTVDLKLSPVAPIGLLKCLISQQDQAFAELVDMDSHTINQLLLGQYLYILKALEGLDSAKHYAHIIVDEAQDFNIFEYAVLKKLNRAHVFTIVGDLNQGIRNYRGLDNWSQLSTLAPKHKQSYDEISTCYRSTVEIVERANRNLLALAHCPLLPKPVQRHGAKPLEYTVDSDKALRTQLLRQIADMADLKSIAVLLPNKQLALEIAAHLQQNDLEPNLIDEHSKEYLGGLSVLPIYHAKGLEFDGVILVDQPTTQQTELYHKMRYVAMTRALHRLVIIEYRPS